MKVWVTDLSGKQQPLSCQFTMWRDIFWTSHCTAISQYASRPVSHPWHSFKTQKEPIVMEKVIYVTFMSSPLTHCCNSVDQYCSWRSVLGQQKGEMQTKYLWLSISCHAINVMNCSDHLGRLYLHQSKTRGITKPHVAL